MKSGLFTSTLGIFLISVAVILFFWRRRASSRWQDSVKLKIATVMVGILGVNLVFWKTFTSGIERTTLLLAISAIIFAFWQFCDSQEQEYRMKRLADGMSTRFAGFFPKNLHVINEVVSNASERLDVMSDFVGYGQYSDPYEFERYFRQLQDLAARRVEVRMLISTREEAERMHGTQFTLESLRKQVAHKDSKLARFCEKFDSDFCARFNENSKRRHHYTDGELNELGRDLYRMMFDRHLFYMKDLIQRGVKIKQRGKPLPLFLWCQDDHEAVFSFLHEHSETAREVSFRTTDSNLVDDTLRKKFEDLWNDPDSKEVRMIMDEGRQEPDWLPPKRQQTIHSASNGGRSGLGPAFRQLVLWIGDTLGIGRL